MAAFRSWSFEDIGVTRLEPGNENQMSLFAFPDFLSS